jgi:hypothetical protein
MNISNKSKNDSRVTLLEHVVGYYWGKKYAYREYGKALAKEAFHEYLKEIGHSVVKCKTRNPESKKFTSASESIAYADFGLEDAISRLIASAVREGKYFKSPLYSKRFTIDDLQRI